MDVTATLLCRLIAIETLKSYSFLWFVLKVEKFFRMNWIQSQMNSTERNRNYSSLFRHHQVWGMEMMLRPWSESCPSTNQQIDKYSYFELHFSFLVEKQFHVRSFRTVSDIAIISFDWAMCGTDRMRIMEYTKSITIISFTKFKTQENVKFVFVGFYV